MNGQTNGQNNGQTNGPTKSCGLQMLHLTSAGLKYNTKTCAKLVHSIPSLCRAAGLTQLVR